VVLEKTSVPQQARINHLEALLQIERQRVYDLQKAGDGGA